MTSAEKLTQLKALLNISGTDQDTGLTALLSLSAAEILSWLYGGNTPEGVSDVPSRYETIQIYSVVVGYSMIGNEGQSSGSENGISRTWSYPTMVEYIHTHVVPFAIVI